MDDETLYKRSREAKSVKGAVQNKSFRLKFKNQVMTFTDEIKIGRAPENDYVINDPLVSRRHCLIECVGDRAFYIKDLESTNATYVNNNPVPRGKRIHLRPGDKIRVGNTEFGFQS